MDAREMLEHWPAFEGLGTEAFVSLPYWRMPVWYADKEGALTHLTAFDDRTDVLTLAITMDGAEHVLKFSDSETFHELHLVWEKRHALPPEILIALCERELGDFFRMIEKTFRCELSVKGLLDSGKTTHGFHLTAKAGTVDFALDLSPAQLQVVRRRDYLDVNSEELRALKRPARAEYGTILLTDAERSALKAGDCLIPPEGDGKGRWMFEFPKDQSVHMMAAAESSLALGELLDNALPPVPETNDIVLVVNGRIIASSVRSTLGLASALKLTSV